MTRELARAAPEGELFAEDEQTRLSAVIRLGQRRQAGLSQRELGALAGCLGATSKTLQRRAAETLAAMAHSDAYVVEIVRRSLYHREPRARWGAAYTLGLIGQGLDNGALPALLEAFSSVDRDVRWAAAKLVVRLGREDPAAISTALVSLARTGDLSARKMALYCLRDMGASGGRVIEAAERAAAAHDALVRLAALALLSRLGATSERAARTALRLFESDPDRGVRRAGAVALGRIGSRSPRVIEGLKRAALEPGDRSIRRAAADALKRLGQ
jgi:HEAT repeat protein